MQNKKPSMGEVSMDNSWNYTILTDEPCQTCKWRILSVSKYSDKLIKQPKNFPPLGCIVTYLFIVLSDKGPWTNFHLGDICVLVQNMDVIIWWDAVDTLLILRCGAPFTAHRSLI